MTATATAATATATATENITHFTKDDSSSSSSSSHSSGTMNHHHHLLRRKVPKRICLFGTSANPPTGIGGHAGIVKALVGLRKFDEVRVLPVYRHTFASKRDQLLGFDHRIAMCELAMEGISSSPGGKLLPPAYDTDTTPDLGMEAATGTHSAGGTRVVVSRAEEDSFRRMLVTSRAETDEEKALLRVGTADLLEMLMEDEKAQEENNDDDDFVASPNTEFSFCLGADTFMDLTDWKWKRSKDVLRLLEGRLVVVNRKQEGAPKNNQNKQQQQQQKQDKSSEPIPTEPLRERIDDTNATPLANGEIILLDIPSLGDVSSSKVRNAGDKDLVKHMLSPKVLDYVIANNLYGFGTDKEDGSIIG
jgi:nicotinic acid mononucleotide adenylyltransferase